MNPHPLEDHVPTPEQSNPYAPPRPSAPPPAGLGWVVVAFLFCWPFALAALPHTLRSSRALGVGDTVTADAAAFRARRLGIWALVVGLVLTALTVVGISTAAGTIAPLVMNGTDAATARLTVDPGPGSGPEDGTPVRDLRDGDCYDTDGLTDVVARVRTVDCAQPHGGEMYYYAETSRGFRGFADEDSVEFPGDAAMVRHVEALCAEKLAALTDDPDAFDVWYVAPDSWLWQSGITDAHCFAERRDGTNVGSIATRTSDN